MMRPVWLRVAFYRYVVRVVFLVSSGLALVPGVRAGELSVVSDFEGASVRVLELDQATRTIRFTPGGEAVRGWPCWWFFRVEGCQPGELLTLHLEASTSVAEPGGQPLGGSWAMPRYATWSADGKTWRQTGVGQQAGQRMTYQLNPETSQTWIAWGPPCTPLTAAAWIREWSARSTHAKPLELCRSREGRSVPMLYIREGDRPTEQRFGVWVQARQHAWESGSSWVARGFAEWLLSDQAEATWLRQHAEVYLVPIMDVDNVATGNGGKNALPWDHNRDWSDQPHWNEVAAARMKIKEWIQAGRMDLFLDLHNPAPGDPTFFYVLEDRLLPPEMVQHRARFIELAYGRISRVKPLIPMSNKPKYTGPSYHPLWKQISANWVSMHGNPQTVSLCLETIWNSSRSTVEGYQTVGAELAAASHQFLAERASTLEQSPHGARGTP